MDNRRTSFACMSSIDGSLERTTCRLGALCYRTTQGARPGQKWPKSSCFNLKSKRKKHSQLRKRLIRLIFYRTGKQMNSHSEIFARSRNVHKHRCSFQCKRPSALSSTQLCRSTVELHYMLEVSLREEHGGVVCVGLAPQRTVSPVTHSNMPKVAERV